MYPEQAKAVVAPAVAAEEQTPAGDPPAVPAKIEEPKSAVEGEATPPVELTVESYKDLVIPEGISVSEPMLEGFKALALEAKLPPEIANKFVALQAEAQKAQVEVFQHQFAENQKLWRSQVDAFPEFQGEARAVTEKTLGTVMEEYGSAEARQIFNESGIGNHPAVVKFILNMANGLVEGEPVPANKPGPLPKGDNRGRSAGGIMYPNLDRPN